MASKVSLPLADSVPGIFSIFSTIFNHEPHAELETKNLIKEFESKRDDSQLQRLVKAEITFGSLGTSLLPSCLKTLQNTVIGLEEEIKLAVEAGNEHRVAVSVAEKERMDMHEELLKSLVEEQTTDSILLDEAKRLAVEDFNKKLAELQTKYTFQPNPKPEEKQKEAEKVAQEPSAEKKEEKIEEPKKEAESSEPAKETIIQPVAEEKPAVQAEEVAAIAPSVEVVSEIPQQ